ncbi:LOW QUALITY PROTEIN: protein FAM177A1 [Sarcophilus harrisii]|uniref:LOW QUALITY PROTEIN: protein FAM177A1 n=1 Tax=Sarcophilus harrisii TaxID=9305 RepID=UPI001301FFFC|nr:LOW QUALITY PROTEIN: protein FAM177A1 [Sarcophilus harrisii]
MLPDAAADSVLRPPGSGEWMRICRPLRFISPTPGAAVAVPRLAMNKEPSRGEDALGAATAVARLREPAGQIQMNCDGNFENVELGVIGKKKKIPKRIIHFVSGETMEEYSTDEDENDGKEQRDLLSTIDPTKLPWGPYLWFYMLRAATSTLSVCDFLGEKIASLLGISTPKYQYAIDEYYRMKKEEEEEEEENRMSEEAERQYQDQQKKLQADSIVQMNQPDTVASSSFVNLNFKMDGDCEVTMENKQNLTPIGHNLE